jgi:nucleoid DNA-binding protein
VNRTDVVKSIANKEKMNSEDVQRILTSFFDLVALNLSVGEDVKLRDFGKFLTRARKPVVRRNPLTGVDHQVPAKASVGFVPSPQLKARANPHLRGN